MSAKEMREALKTIGDDWQVQQPPVPAEVERVFASLPVPPTPELRVLYEHSEGGYVGEVEIFVLLELQQVNREPRYRRDFPSALFFAGDGGDGWFFIDTGNDMGYGEGAIFWVDRSSMTWGRTVPCGDSLPEFLLAVHRGEKPWQENDDLIRQTTDAMLALLDANPGLWVGNPPATITQIYDAARQIGAPVSYPLTELLLKSNGLVFAKTGIAIAGVQQFIGIGNLPGVAGAPPAMLVGQDRQYQYAVTTAAWRDLAHVASVGEGFAVRAQPGQWIGQGEVLGWLPYVVEEWLKPQTPEGQDK